MMPVLRGLVVVFVLLSSSCATRQFERMMRDWQGKTLLSLLNTWGPPRYAFADRQGGHVIAYVPDAHVPSPPLPRVLTDAASVAARLYRREDIHTRPVYVTSLSSGWRVFRIFFVDEQGTVTRTEWKGEWACCGT